MFCTYIYSDPKTGIVRYVGKGVPSRPMSHVKYGSHNRQLHNMIQKRLREGFKLTPIILDARSEDDAKEMEMLLISLIGREDLNEGTLFNKTDGGEGCKGRKASLEERKRNSELQLNRSPEQKAKIAAKISAANSGRKFTAEQNKSKGRKGRKMTKTSALAKPCTVDGITIFKSARELISVLGRGKNGARSPNFRYL